MVTTEQLGFVRKTTMFFLHENQSKKEERHFTNSPRATSNSLNDTVMTREEF